MSVQKLLFAASAAAMMMVSATAWAQSEPMPCAEGVSRDVGNFSVTLVAVTDEGGGLVTYSYDVCKILQDNGLKGKDKVTYPALSHFVWDLMHIDCLANDAQLDDLIAGACMGYVDADGIVTEPKCDIVYELGYDPTTGTAGIKINVDGIDSEGNPYKYETNGCLRFEVTFDENALKDGCVLVTGEIVAASKAGQNDVIATVCGPVCLCVPTVCTGETAWAKGDLSKCFLEYGTSIPSNRWGWSNALPYADGTYTLALYAGAGQCDTTKGALVGTVTVVINTTTGTAIVSYNVTAEGWTLGTTHVYVGNDPIPTGPNGKKLTVAPGQLGSTKTDGTPHVIDIHYDGTGPIHVLAHAEVEYCEED